MQFSLLIVVADRLCCGTDGFSGCGGCNGCDVCGVHRWHCVSCRGGGCGGFGGCCGCGGCDRNCRCVECGGFGGCGGCLDFRMVWLVGWRCMIPGVGVGGRWWAYCGLWCVCLGVLMLWGGCWVRLFAVGVLCSGYWRGVEVQLLIGKA